MSLRRLAVPAEAGQLPVLTRFLQEFWASAALPAQGIYPFQLALEELFTNVVRHGSPAGSVPRVEVSLSLAEGSLTMVVEDDGLAFDPLSLPAPDVEASVETRPVGGLGVYLVRQLMDAVSYRRDGGHNQLRLTKHLAT